MTAIRQELKKGVRMQCNFTGREGIVIDVYENGQAVILLDDNEFYVIFKSETFMVIDFEPDFKQLFRSAMNEMKHGDHFTIVNEPYLPWNLVLNSKLNYKGLPTDDWKCTIDAKGKPADGRNITVNMDHIEFKANQYEITIKKLN